MFNLFFLKMIEAYEMKSQMILYKKLCQNLGTKNFSFKTQIKALALMDDIELIFPKCIEISSKFSAVKKYVGLTSLLIFENCFFLYEIKINERKKQMIVEIMMPPGDIYSREFKQKLAYKILQYYTYLIVNNY